MTTPVTVRMWSGWPYLLVAVPTIVCAGLAFTIRPIVNWIVGLIGSAPGPLRLAAELPTVWAVPVLAGVGFLIGLWLAQQALEDSLVLTVAHDHVSLIHEGEEKYVPRERVAQAFRDGKDLVLLDAESAPIARHNASDLDAAAVSDAFRQFGYPWIDGGDPNEAAYRKWVEGHPDLPEDLDKLMLARRRALADGKAGEAAAITDRLNDHGVILRDRDGAQQYRRR
ncbi:hypothetical protein [Stackebrandtia soli]|uniref:YqeB family protein n=1 Tax=Stackebrandtia soli TaxID=1892856 RepID=UPI0039EAA007